MAAASSSPEAGVSDRGPAAAKKQNLLINSALTFRIMAVRSELLHTIRPDHTERRTKGSPRMRLDRMTPAIVSPRLRSFRSRCVASVRATRGLAPENTRLFPPKARPLTRGCWKGPPARSRETTLAQTGAGRRPGPAALLQLSASSNRRLHSQHPLSNSSLTDPTAL